MTTIRAKTQDQVLIATILPKLACNSKKAVELHVDFDSTWGDFPTRQAIFTTSNDPTPYPVLLSATGDCTLPEEVLADDGYLFITIQGTNSSTDAMKPTTQIRYKILPGTPSLLVSAPSGSVYSRLVSRDAELSAEIATERVRINNLAKLVEGSTTGDAELVDIRVGADGKTYDSAGAAVRSQVGAVMQSSGESNPLQPLLFDKFVYYRGSDKLKEGEELAVPCYNFGNLAGYSSYTNEGASTTNLIGAKLCTPVPVFETFTGEYVLIVKIDREIKNCVLFFGNAPNWNADYSTFIRKNASLAKGYNVIHLDNGGEFNNNGHNEYSYFYVNFTTDLISAGVTELEMYLIKSDTFIGYVQDAIERVKSQGIFSENARSAMYSASVGYVKPRIASYMSDVLKTEDGGAYRLIDNPSDYRLIVSNENHIEGATKKWFQGFCLELGKKAEAIKKTLYIDVKSNDQECTMQSLSKLALHNSTSNWNGVNISAGLVKVSDVDLSAYSDDDEIYLIFGVVAGTSSAPRWNENTCDLTVTVLEKTNGYVWADDINFGQKYITCWGDSLTSLGGWTSRLQELSGMVVHNAGTGGENVRTITARQGADVIMLNNITIPATVEPVTLATYNKPFQTALGYNVTPLLQGSPHVNPVRIGGVEGTLKWTGSSYNDTTGTWTFTRSEVGEAVTINRPTALVTAYDREKNAPHLMIIFMGQNGGYNANGEALTSLNSIKELVKLHKRMINHAKARHTIILGLSSGSAKSREDYETAMKDAFGRYFISLREYLSEYGLADAGLTPTEEDTAAMNSGIVPPQLLSDAVHYTSATKTVIGNLIYKRCCELGIFDS